MNSLKNMLVLKDLPSNLIEEAYIVLNPNVKLKMDQMENKQESEKVANNKVLSKNYILEEAKYVLLNYVSKYENRVEKINARVLERKYKKLKKITISILVTFLLYVIVTGIM